MPELKTPHISVTADEDLVINTAVTPDTGSMPYSDVELATVRPTKWGLDLLVKIEAFRQALGDQASADNEQRLRHNVN